MSPAAAGRFDWAAEYGSRARFHAFGIGGAVGAQIHRYSTREYAREHFRLHGTLPTGLHRVPVRYPGAKGGFDAVFPDAEQAALAIRAALPDA
jgi:hypothetical protein